MLGLAAAVGAGGALGAVFGRSAPTILRAGAEAHAKLPIGMHLSTMADWNPGFPFLNLMWGARIWLTRNVRGDGPWNTGMAEKLEMDENGYPLEVPFRPIGAAAAQYVFTILPNRLEAGKYVILYDGQGEFGVAGQTRIIAARPGRVEISMEHKGGDPNFEAISIRRSERGDHVRNIRVLPIEHEHTDLEKFPFRPEALEFCKQWHCLRFMEWQGVCNSVDQKWSDRKRRTFYTQVGTTGDALGVFGSAVPAWERKWSSGVAVELCVQLANMTGTDAWLCVPHLADDEYITEMAKLVKAQLNPSLKVYVEYSNEVWNWDFHQAQWMIRSELAGDLVTATGATPPWKARARPAHFRDGIVVPGAGEGTDHPERIGALFRRCFKIWEDVFTGADRKRLVRVCAVQSAWFDTIKQTLNWVMKNGGCDVLSPAGYFGPNDAVYRRWEAAGAKLTADDVIEDMWPMIVETGQLLQESVKFAKKAGVRLVAYEGGQHIQPQGQAEKPYNPALGAAQKHPAMYDLYRANLTQHAKAGCDLFCIHTSVGLQGTRWGSWGHVEHYRQRPDEMPKYRAIVEANTPRSAM